MTNLMLTLESVCEFIVDCLHATAPIQETGFPLIRTPNIGKGRLSIQEAYRVSEDVYLEWTRRAVPLPDDLILAREATAGNVAIVQEGQNVCLGQRTVHLRPDKTKVNPRFLCYYLLSPKIQGELLAGETGATAKHVNMRDIRRLNLGRLPPQHIQEQIADVISSYDDLIDNNRRRIQLLEESTRLLYKEWFVHLRYPGHEHVEVMNGIPTGWSKQRLGDIAQLRYGKGLKEEDRIKGDIYVYGSSGVVGTHNEPLVKGPGIIVGRKGNVGSIFWADFDYYPIDTVFFVPSEQSSLYLYHTLQNISFVNTDGAVPGLNRDLAHSREVLQGPHHLQEQFEEVARNIQKQITLLKKQIDTSTKARDLLLPRLMNGELIN